MELLKQHIILVYRTRWEDDENNDNYFFNWLENDLLAWLNNDEPLMYGAKKKLVDFFNRIPDLDLNDVLSNRIDVKESIVKMFKVITLDELKEFERFMVQ